jgi:DNA topoisomerase I
MPTLVIVESPTKAKTIRNFLPSDYRVEASMGHVRDLPSSAEEVPPIYKGKSWASFGVNIENDFEPLYVIPKTKTKVVSELKKALQNASELILATDEDREGESISWHLKEVLKPKIPIKRMVFHEITPEAIKSALNNCRDIDNNLVRAQETRRILDRLVGYTVSPLLWKKISKGLSAGRVQSVAVRLLVRRERERQAFKTASYWDLKAILAKEEAKFEAKLMTLGGKKLAIGSDFDPSTGRLFPNKDVVLLNESEAVALRDRLSDKVWRVTKTEERPTTRKPAPPFTTSTLQQESNRKIGMSARETMSVAQKLYEQGYITYMRTDSVHLSEQAISAARNCVEQKYGKEYLSPKPRQYSTKSKGAQEAHEAIRPAGSSFRTPQETPLSGMELRLYDLIWKRTVASQMAEARLTQIAINIEVEDAGFRSSGKRIDFPGFFRAYVEGSDDPDAAIEDREVILPDLREGDRPNCKQLDPLGHQTEPPARYSEASLVKTLESEGVGRPSTYASIIGTIVDRGYVQIRNKTLIPTFTAFAVTSLLEEHFPDLVDTNFTSKMERTLDEIATGEAKWLPYLDKFYLGEAGLGNQVKVREKEIDSSAAKTVTIENVPVKIKISYYGPYLETEYEDRTVTASLPQDITPADLSPTQIEQLIRQKLEGPEKLGFHPETGEPIYVLTGRYGPYLQLGEKTEETPKPKQASIPKKVKLEEVTLEMAMGYLALPRALGEHPLDGCAIKAAIGPFGPYVVHDRGKEGKDYRSLKADDNILTISLERAIELLSQPKSGRGGRGSKQPLKELGIHPNSEEPINIYKGPYGNYIKYDKTNVGLPEGETIESMTLEKALQLLATKVTTKKTTKKTGAKSKATQNEDASETKKTTKKKTTVKKTTTAKKTASSRSKKTAEDKVS